MRACCAGLYPAPWGVAQPPRRPRAQWTQEEAGCLSAPTKRPEGCPSLSLFGSGSLFSCGPCPAPSSPLNSRTNKRHQDGGDAHPPRHPEGALQLGHRPGGPAGPVLQHAAVRLAVRAPCWYCPPLVLARALALDHCGGHRLRRSSRSSRPGGLFFICIFTWSTTLLSAIGSCALGEGMGAAAGCGGGGAVSGPAVSPRPHARTTFARLRPFDNRRDLSLSPSRPATLASVVAPLPPERPCPDALLCPPKPPNPPTSPPTRPVTNAGRDVRTAPHATRLHTPLPPPNRTTGTGLRAAALAAAAAASPPSTL